MSRQAVRAVQVGLALGLILLATTLGSRLETHRSNVLALVCSLLLGATIAFWLACPAWLSPRFRAAMRWLLIRASWPRHFFWDSLSGKRWGHILLAAGCGVLVWQYLHINLSKTEELLDWPLGLVMAVFLYMALRTRAKIFVADFNDHSGEDWPDCGKALASRLRNDLSRIATLFATFDEALPVRRSRLEELQVGVQDDGADFKETLGQSLTIPKLGLTAGALVSVVSGLLRAARLTGALHKEGTRYVLTAQISGGGRKGSWCVTSEDLPDPDKPLTSQAAIYKLLEQLAYRIMTTQLDLGSPRWEAVRAFTEGLRAYRLAQRTERDKSIHLREAERAFIRAWGDDNQFVQCHYDLGVVYQQIGQIESAESAFRRTIALDPDRFEPYYALARVYFDKEDYHNAEIHADKALAIRPFDARALNLRGLARLCAKKNSSCLDDWDFVNTSFERAAALAWRSLCHSIWSFGPDSQQAKDRTELAAICTGNLAESLADRARCLINARSTLKRSLSTYRQTLVLSPHNSGFHFGFGRSLHQAQRWSEAREHLYDAFGDGLELADRARRWAYAVAVESHLHEEGNAEAAKDAERAYGSFLDFAVPSEKVLLAAGGKRSEKEADEYLHGLDILAGDLKILRLSPPIDGKDYIASMQRAVDFLRKVETATDLANLKQCEGFGEDEKDWAQAQVRLRFAREKRLSDPATALSDFDQAIKYLKEHHRHRQVEKQGLVTLQALARVALGQKSHDWKELTDALFEADRSAREEPSSADRRFVLSESYSAFSDFDQVFQESDTSLDLSSMTSLLGNPLTLTFMASDWYERAARLHGGEEWKAAHKKGCQFFGKALRLIESQPMDERQIEAHAVLHFWLGRFHCRLMCCDEAIKHLQIAVSMGVKPILGNLELGRAYCEAGAFQSAETAYWTALRESRKPPRSDLETWRMDDKKPGLRVEILLRRALLYIERDIKLPFADRLARIAWQSLTAAKQAEIDPKYKKELRALHHLYVGRKALREGNVETAVSELGKATEMRENAAGVYYHWAAAFAAKAEAGIDRERSLKRASELCDHAARIDVRQKYAKLIADLRLRLDKAPEPREELRQVPFLVLEGPSFLLP